MKIQLDTGAMNALFPEGSEARVQLQNAVIANFARNNLDKYISQEMKKTVEQVARAEMAKKRPDILNYAAKEALDEYFKNHWGNLSLIGSGRAKLREEAKKAAIEALKDAAHDAVWQELTTGIEKVVSEAKKHIPEYLDEIKRVDFQKRVRAAAQKMLASAAAQGE